MGGTHRGGLFSERASRYSSGVTTGALQAFLAQQFCNPATAQGPSSSDHAAQPLQVQHTHLTLPPGSAHCPQPFLTWPCLPLEPLLLPLPYFPSSSLRRRGMVTSSSAPNPPSLWAESSFSSGLSFPWEPRNLKGGAQPWLLISFSPSQHPGLLPVQTPG